MFISKLHRLWVKLNLASRDVIESEVWETLGRFHGRIWITAKASLFSYDPGFFSHLSARFSPHIKALSKNDSPTHVTHTHKTHMHTRTLDIVICHLHLIYGLLKARRSYTRGQTLSLHMCVCGMGRPGVTEVCWGAVTPGVALLFG